MNILLYIAINCFADEATSALDATSRILVFEAIKKWRHNKTTVVITHDLSQIGPNDFLYVLKSGELVEQGYREELEVHEESEFTRMLRVQGSADGFQERTDEELGDRVSVGAILEQQDVAHNEQLEAVGINIKNLTRQSVYRPLTMSNWMFDVVSDLTKPTSAATAPAVPPKDIPTSRFIPTEAFSSDAPVSPRRQSFDIPPIASPPPAYNTLSRRLSLQFTPTSPKSFSFPKAPYSGDDDEESIALDRRVLRPVRSTASLASQSKRVRMKWDDSKLAPLKEVKVVEAPAVPEKPMPPQPSLIRLLIAIWPTVPLKALFVFGLLISLLSGAITPIFSYVLSRLQYEVSIGATDMSAINLFGGISLAVCATDGIFMGLKYFVMEYVAMDWVNAMRKTCFDIILRQDRKWFDKSENSPNRIMEILIKDGDDSRSLIATVMSQALVVTAMLGVGLIWALVEGWQLTLVGLAIAPVFAITMAVQTNLVAKCEYRNKRAREVITKSYYEVRLRPCLLANIITHPAFF